MVMPSVQRDAFDVRTACGFCNFVVMTLAGVPKAREAEQQGHSGSKFDNSHGVYLGGGVVFQ